MLKQRPKWKDVGADIFLEHNRTTWNFLGHVNKPVSVNTITNAKLSVKSKHTIR